MSGMLGPKGIQLVAETACRLQGLTPGRYQGLPAATRESFERGTEYTLRALEALGVQFFVPADVAERFAALERGEQPQ